MWMDYKLVATSFHEDYFDEPFLLIQFSFRIIIFSCFIDSAMKSVLTGITLSYIQFRYQTW